LVLKEAQNYCETHRNRPHSFLQKPNVLHNTQECTLSVLTPQVALLFTTTDV